MRRSCTRQVLFTLACVGSQTQDGCDVLVEVMSSQEKREKCKTSIAGAYLDANTHSSESVHPARAVVLQTRYNSVQTRHSGIQTRHSGIQITSAIYRRVQRYTDK